MICILYRHIWISYQTIQMRIESVIAFLGFVAATISLEITESEAKNGWETLSRKLSEATELQLRAHYLSYASLKKILSHQMPKLQILSFGSKHDLQIMEDESLKVLTPQLAKIIFSSPYFPKLKELNLADTGLDDRAFSFLDDPAFNMTCSLQQLGLNQLQLSRKGFQRLARLRFQGQLKFIQIRNTLLLQQQAVDSLLKIVCRYQSGVCHSQLEYLDISNTGISRDGFIKVIQTINRTSLMNFYIDGINLHQNKLYLQGSNYTAFQVLAGKEFPSLKKLSLEDTGFNNHAAMILSQWKIPNIKAVFLDDNPLGDEGIKAWITSERMPALQILSTGNTNLTDDSIDFIVKQKFVMQLFNFGETKITDNGFRHLLKLNTSKLQYLLIVKLYISEETISSVLNQLHFPKLKTIFLQNLIDTPNLLNLITWSRFPELTFLSIQNVYLQDGYEKFMNEKVVAQKVEQLVLTNTGINSVIQYQLISLMPKMFPKLRKFKITQERLMPVSLAELSQAGFAEGTEMDFGYFKAVKQAKKVSVRQIQKVTLLLFSIISIKDKFSSFEIEDIVPVLLTKADFNNINTLSIAEALDLRLAIMIFKAANITTFQSLQFFGSGTELSAQQFFAFFNEHSFPNIVGGQIWLTIPGDADEAFIENKLIPFFRSFPNLYELHMSLTFLNEEEGADHRKLLMDSLHYPLLVAFKAYSQELRVQDLTAFIKRHAPTLKIVELGGNFLEKGFLDLFIHNDVRVQDLHIQQIYFTVQEFTKLAQLDTSFMIELKISANDLTNEHFEALVSKKGGKPLFPKMKAMVLQQNNIGEQGLQALMETGMPNLQLIDIERNINPGFLNLLLRYLNKIKILYAEDIEIYSLDKNISSETVHHISLLNLNTFSFSQEDFNILGGLEFTRLQQSTLKMRNIYNCQSLKNLLNVNRWVSKINIDFQNDEIGFNSSCLQNYSHYTSRAQELVINDMFGTTALAEYIELVTKSSLSIKNLQLAKTRLSSQSLKRILNNNFDGIVFLNLRYNYLEDQALFVILDNDLDHLNILDLSYNSLTVKSLEGLAQKGLPSLVYLDISRNNLQFESVSPQIIGSFAPSLLGLKMLGCNLGKDMLSAFLQIDFDRLQMLDLSYNIFSEQEVVYFLLTLQKRKMPSLINLKIKGTPLSKENYELIERVLAVKGIVDYQFQRPYNIPQPNSAGY